MQKIQVIAVDNCLNFYPENLLRDVFEFRYLMVERLGWTQGLTLQKTSMGKNLSETDDQDKPGTVYFTKKSDDGLLAGVIRISPSMDITGKSISMISQVFNDLVYPDRKVPAAENIWETSRILVDRDLYKTPQERQPVVDSLIASTFFYAHEKGIKSLFCFMAEGLWKSTYMRIGLDVERLGPNKVINDRDQTYDVYAGEMKIDDSVIKRIEKNTGLNKSILDYGSAPSMPFRPSPNLSLHL